jgi:hypothetical protein
MEVINILFKKKKKSEELIWVMASKGNKKFNYEYEYSLTDSFKKPNENSSMYF